MTQYYVLFGKRKGYEVFATNLQPDVEEEFWRELAIGIQLPLEYVPIKPGQVINSLYTLINRRSIYHLFCKYHYGLDAIKRPGYVGAAVVLVDNISDGQSIEQVLDTLINYSRRFTEEGDNVTLRPEELPAMATSAYDNVLDSRFPEGAGIVFLQERSLAEGFDLLLKSYIGDQFNRVFFTADASLEASITKSKFSTLEEDVLVKMAGEKETRIKAHIKEKFDAFYGRVENAEAVTDLQLVWKEIGEINPSKFGPHESHVSTLISQFTKDIIPRRNAELEKMDQARRLRARVEEIGKCIKALDDTTNEEIGRITGLIGNIHEKDYPQLESKLVEGVKEEKREELKRRVDEVEAESTRHYNNIAELRQMYFDKIHRMTSIEDLKLFSEVFVSNFKENKEILAALKTSKVRTFFENNVRDIQKEIDQKKIDLYYVKQSSNEIAAEKGKLRAHSSASYPSRSAAASSNTPGTSQHGLTMEEAGQRRSKIVIPTVKSISPEKQKKEIKPNIQKLFKSDAFWITVIFILLSLLIALVFELQDIFEKKPYNK